MSEHDALGQTRGARGEEQSCQVASWVGRHSWVHLKGALHEVRESCVLSRRSVHDDFLKQVSYEYGRRDLLEHSDVSEL